MALQYTTTGGKTLFYPYFAPFIPLHHQHITGGSHHYHCTTSIARSLSAFFCLLHVSHITTLHNTKKAYTLTSVSLSKLKQPIKEIDCLLYQIIVCYYIHFLLHKDFI